MHDGEQPDSNYLRQSRTAEEMSIGTPKQEKIKIPPSVSNPAKRKRIDVGGKIYEDELMVLNARLKRFGYESAIALLLVQLVFNMSL